MIIWQLRQRMRVMQTIQARDWLWNEMGKPIKKYGDLPDNLKSRDVIILRNPKKTPEKIDSITKALQNLTPERMDEIRKARSDQGVDIEQILDDLAVDDISHSPSELYYDPRTMKAKPAWLESETDLRYVPRGVAVGRLGRTFCLQPDGLGLGPDGDAERARADGDDLRPRRRCTLRRAQLPAEHDPARGHEPVGLPPHDLGRQPRSRAQLPGGARDHEVRVRLLRGDGAARVQHSSSRTGADGRARASPHSRGAPARGSATTPTSRCGPAPTGRTRPTGATPRTPTSTGC